ncbi:deoxyribonuclease IV [Atopobiaceae bacterium HCP3S3_F7]
MREERLVLGCHLSVAKGLSAAARTAASIGATTFAFFTRNPRGGRAKDLAEKDVLGMRRICEDGGFGTLVAHAPYTLNLASAKPDVVRYGREALAADLARLDAIGGCYLNLHPGSHVGQGADRGIELVCEGLDEVLAQGFETRVLLETMAGKGSEVGRSFEELERIIEGAREGDALGVCLDTCHVSDAGYDVAHDLGGVLDEFDRVIGLERLCALHVNDSKNPCGSHKDRHERIGEGTLGLGFFAELVRDPRTRGLPMILETPNELPGYEAEIALLRRLASGGDAEGGAGDDKDDAAAGAGAPAGAGGGSAAGEEG